MVVKILFGRGRVNLIYFFLAFNVQYVLQKYVSGNCSNIQRGVGGGGGVREKPRSHSLSSNITKYTYIIMFQSLCSGDLCFKTKKKKEKVHALIADNS